MKKLQLRYVHPAFIVLALLLAAPVAAQTGVIKGKVKLKDAKSSVGVTVRVAQAKDEKEQRETKTDAKGEFEFGALAGGDYALTFAHPGYKTFTTRKMAVAAGETVKLNRVIELARESDPYAVIRGAVLHSVGFTLPNAAVTIERIDEGGKFKQETVSREGGEFAFRLKAEKATYRITAAARGFQPSAIEITIESDEVRNVAVTLQPAK